MTGAVLAEILSYPVKSLAGAAHDVAHVQPLGLAQDRRWMVVDTAGRFMTQREHPRLAVLHAAAQEDGALHLSAPDIVPLRVPAASDGREHAVRVWRDTVQARDCGEAAAAWMAQALGVNCRLVHMADPHARKRGAFHVGFADGYPVLLASQSSLADLNARLGTPVPMSRFRPNLVIAGAPAWAEDTWRRVRIGETIFRVSKPCERCIMTTIDQRTGSQPDGNEPLSTLATFRRDASGKIMFAQNLVPEACGDVRVGDAVHIIEEGTTNVIRK